MKYTSIGGQAVMEGVMMRSKTSMVMSVRRSDGSIAVERVKLSTAPWRKNIAKIPIVRGVVSFVDSLVQGMRLTSRSAELYGEDAVKDVEPSKFEKWLSKTFKIKIETVAIVLGIILGLALSFALFIFLPSLVSKGIWGILSAVGVTKETASLGIKLLLDIVEGLVKIAIFICYILGISFMKDIKRLFMYHGAEHKVISCYEHGDELTVENARKYSTSHPRCGTSFILIIMVIGILITAVADHLFNLSTATAGDMIFRFAVKLLLLPLTAGVSYEILKFLAKSDNLLFRILRAPGMALQKLTTRQPLDDMLEVSITSFKNVLYMDGLMEEPQEESEEAGTQRQNDACAREEDSVPEKELEPTNESEPKSSVHGENE